MQSGPGQAPGERGDWTRLPEKPGQPLDASSACKDTPERTSGQGEGDRDLCPGLGGGGGGSPVRVSLVTPSGVEHGPKRGV